MLTFFARLHGMTGKSGRKRAEASLKQIGLSDAGNKKISAYSLGMRQRLKLAVSIQHDPEIVILDEPLRGVDPLWRSKIMEMIRTFGDEGRTVIVSSHILSEIETMTENIVLIHQGKIFAHGNIQEIRNLIDSHPHQISIRCRDVRKLGKELILLKNVISLQFEDDGEGMVCTTNHRDAFYNNLMKLIVTKKMDVSEISSADDNLQAVFSYLIERK
jgi:ABC-2 type transport system ATP-binding protein